MWVASVRACVTLLNDSFIPEVQFPCNTEHLPVDFFFVMCCGAVCCLLSFRLRLDMATRCVHHVVQTEDQEEKAMWKGYKHVR